MPYDKIYGLEHLAIYLVGKFKKVKERDVVYVLYAFQILIVLIGLIIFRNSIF